MLRRTCFLAIALAALGVCLASGAVLAADGWEVLDQIFPAKLGWDETAEATVDAENTGTTTWDSSYGLLSIEGPSTAVVPLNRWGVTFVPVAGVTVPPTSTHLFEFTITGPPITTLKYTAPVGAVDPGTVDGLSADFYLAKQLSPTSYAVITTDRVMIPSIVVGRFSDVAPDTPGAWSRFWVEELAGRVPVVVQGYPDGTYKPAVRVQRDAMAVYISRALGLELGPYQGLFSDVPGDYWARGEIEALVGTGVVQGYPNGTYRPTEVVNRDSMAVYVARGMAGGDANVPPGPPANTFPDVPLTFWAYKYVEYAVDQDVVQGYPDGTYRPFEAVDRGQMAVYVWRGFVAPTGSAMVLAGPDTTSGVDPADPGPLGWGTVDVNPGYAYVAFDAVRMDASLVPPTAPMGTWDVRFELRPGVTPTTSVTASHTVSLTPAEITAAKAAAVASGDPYLVMSWDLSGEAVPPGEYTLVVLVEDKSGVMREIVTPRPVVTFV